MGTFVLVGVSRGLASSLASIEENALFFKSNDKLEAYPTIKTTVPEAVGVESQTVEFRRTFVYYAELVLLVIAVIQVVYALRLPATSIARRNSLRLAVCFGVVGFGLIIWHFLSRS